jgi:predicted dehydrogenase
MKWVSTLRRILVNRLHHQTTVMTSDTLRWGILGTARIIGKNWRAIHESGRGVVTAVASRDLDKARRFIRERQAEAAFEPEPCALGSYEELINRSDVDAVYVPLPTGLREEWIVRAARAGKHILSEKPAATGLAPLRRILDACAEHNVQYMDGVMFMHDPRLERVRAVLDDGTSIGPVRRMDSAFSFCAPDDFNATNIRTQSALEPAGCVGDLGWYCIRYFLWVMKGAMPLRVSGRSLKEVAGHGSAAPVPVDFSGELFFDGDVSASFHCSFRSAQQTWVQVGGEKGYVRVLDFIAAANPCDFDFEVNYRPVARVRPIRPTPESEMFRHFAELVDRGTPDPFWPGIVWKTQQIMEACLESACRKQEMIWDGTGYIQRPS